MHQVIISKWSPRAGDSDASCFITLTSNVYPHDSDTGGMILGYLVSPGRLRVRTMGNNCNIFFLPHSYNVRFLKLSKSGNPRSRDSDASCFLTSTSNVDPRGSDAGGMILGSPVSPGRLRVRTMGNNYNIFFLLHSCNVRFLKLSKSGNHRNIFQLKEK